jgi:hypothetical protein
MQRTDPCTLETVRGRSTSEAGPRGKSPLRTLCSTEYLRQRTLSRRWPDCQERLVIRVLHSHSRMTRAIRVPDHRLGRRRRHHRRHHARPFLRGPAEFPGRGTAELLDHQSRRCRCTLGACTLRRGDPDGLRPPPLSWRAQDAGRRAPRSSGSSFRYSSHAVQPLQAGRGSRSLPPASLSPSSS